MLKKSIDKPNFCSTLNGVWIGVKNVSVESWVV